jgi:ATP-binding cassette subfamily B protein
LFQDFNRYRSLNAGDNITMGDPGRRQSKRRREMAAHRAGADAFINNFPKAYEQILNRSFENGIEPSGGQWQRIALARAFYRDAAVLILDERLGYRRSWRAEILTDRDYSATQDHA